MARYLIDVNLPRWFSLWSGSDYDFMHDIGPDWTDSRIWEFAAANALTIVTKDADFSDRVLVNVNGPRVIHVRVGNLTIGDLHRYLSASGRTCARQARAAGSCRCTGIVSKPSSEQMARMEPPGRTFGAPEGELREIRPTSYFMGPPA